MSDKKLFSYFGIEIYTNLVRTKSKGIQEYRSSFRPIMIRDLYSLKTFGSGFGIEMKGGKNKEWKTQIMDI